MKECRPPVDGSQLITQSNVEIGKPKLNPCFYSTSTASHYRPATVPVTRARTQVSMVQLGGHDRKEWQTTMQSDYQVPVQDKQRLCASHLQQLKYSHITAPSSQQYHFTTLQRDSYCPKAIPPTAEHGNLFQSNLPL
ncbi:uncharacterized protein si:dkey-13m1.5 [Acipenser ruthenus]|uniref:uncharacterized protein si:dkey-13m1.5 n=1 Tax=Acipenser ruthenus TaxID=7906 RepID=UPI0027408E02|nr:uncharacterized protein si:dkey-13m1.5 [Acipenser ruthenus]